MINYRVDAKVELIDKMISPILSSLEEVGANKKALYQLHLSLEELFSNIANYAYDKENGYIDISYQLDKVNNSIKVIVKDKGKAFNPLEEEDPNLKGTAKERKVGGLGIYIIKNSVDDIKYQRLNEENVLEFSKKY